MKINSSLIFRVYLSIALLLTLAARVGAQLPAPWTSSDVGNVAAAGHATISNGVYKVYGSGEDIYNQADEFHYLYQPISGDFEIIAGMFQGLSNTDPWAKFGLMARESLAAGARNAFVFFTPGHGSGFQWRATTGGPTQYVPGTSGIWLKLVRSGNTFTSYTSWNKTQWELVGSVTLDLPNSIYLGFAVTSHKDGVIAEAVFDQVEISTPGGTGLPPAPTLSAEAASPTEIWLRWTNTDTSVLSFDVERSTNGTTFTFLGTWWQDWPGIDAFDSGLTPGTHYWYRVKANNPNGSSPWSNIADATTPTTGGALPSPWQSQDIGGPQPAGSSTFSSNVFSVKGGGADIWGTSDQFQYAYQPISGDFEMIAWIDSLEPGDVSSGSIDFWAKAGIMVRETLSANSKNVMLFRSFAHGEGLQWRAATGGQTSYLSEGSFPTGPLWIKVTRTGNVFSFYWLASPNNWNFLGTATIDMAASVYVGFAVTSHSNGVSVNGTFGGVSITSGGGGGGNTLPSPWQHQDVGAVSFVGSASYSSGTFSVKAASADIWNTADAFHFVYQPWSGDGQIVARVATIEDTSPWAKAGVMFRQSLDANSANAFMMVTPAHGSGFQSRSAAGSTSTYVAGPFVSPGWVKLVRSGNVFTGYISTDGVNWTFVSSQTIAMTGTIQVGLALTSHNVGASNTSTFDNATVGP